MQTQTFKRAGIRAVAFAALLSLAGGILYTGWHSGDLARALAALHNWLEPTSTSTTYPSNKESAASGDDTTAAWRNWLAQGKRWSSGISQTIGRHVPRAAVAMAQQAATAVDAVISGPHSGGSSSFTQTVTVLPGTPGWFDHGGSGGGGGNGGGGGTNCHQTNSCGGGGTDCHQTNTCGGGGHHNVSESSSFALLLSGIAAFGVLLRRRLRPAKVP